VKQPNPGTPATHLKPFYDILGLSIQNGDLPEFVRDLRDGKGCRVGPFLIFNPSSPTCMTGFAFPPPP